MERGGGYPYERTGMLGSDLACDLAISLGESGENMLSAAQRYDMDLQQKMEQKMEVPGTKVPDMAHLQFNLLREQIGNLARELTAARQDINTLRLAGSQSEMQNAELSRHVRETEAQLRAEVSNQFRELDGKIEISVSTAMVQGERAVRGVDELQDRMDYDLAQLKERISKSSVAADMRLDFASVKQVQRLERLLEEKCKGFDSVTAEVLKLKSDFDAQMIGGRHSLRQAFDDLVVQTGGEMQRLNEKFAALNVYMEAVEQNTKISLTSLDENVRTALNSSNQEMGAGIQKLAKDNAEKIKDLQDLFTDLAATAENTREELGAIEQLQADVEDHKSQTTKALASHYEMINGQRQLVFDESGKREVAHSAIHDRLDEIHRNSESRLKTELGRLGEEHTERHKAHEAHVKEHISTHISSVKDHLSSVATSERAAREELVQQTLLADDRRKVELQSHVSWLKNELSEHKIGAEEFQSQLKVMLENERMEREKAHKNTHNVMGERFEDAERRLRESTLEFSSIREKSVPSTMLESLEQKFMNKLNVVVDDHGNKHEQLKGTTSSGLDNLDRKIALEVQKCTEDNVRNISDNKRHIEDNRRLLEENKRTIEELGLFHADLRDMVKQSHKDNHGKHTEVHNVIQGLDQQLRDLIVRQGSENDGKVSSSVVALERKMREQLDGLSRDHNEHKERTAKVTKDHNDQLSSMASDHSKQLADMKEHFTKTHAAHQDALEDHRKSAAAERAGMTGNWQSQLAALEAKLQLETQKSFADATSNSLTYESVAERLKEHVQSSVKEHIGKERDDRESSQANHATISHVQELERKFKETLKQVASSQENSHTSLTGNLGAIERQLREELDSVHEEHSNRTADLKNQFQSALNDHGARHMELQEMIAKVKEDEKKAREGHQGGLVSQLEGLEAGLKRELALGAERHQGNLEESVAQERTKREKSHATLLDRLLDVENFAQETGAKSKAQMGHADRITDLEQLMDDRQGRDKIQGPLNASLNDRLSDMENMMQDRQMRDRVQAVLADRLTDIEHYVQEQQSRAKSHAGHVDRLADLEYFMTESQAREKITQALHVRFGDLEAKVAEEITRASIRDSGVAENCETVAQSCSKELKEMQRALSKEQEFRAMQIDNFNKLVLQERAARESQQESLRVYLTNEKVARDEKDTGDLITREEFEQIMKRLWAEIRNHTHDVHAFNMANVGPKMSPPRSPSPMPAQMLSPKRLSMTGMVPIPTVSVPTVVPAPQTLPLQQMPQGPLQQMPNQQTVYETVVVAPGNSTRRSTTPRLAAQQEAAAQQAAALSSSRYKSYVVELSSPSPQVPMRSGREQAAPADMRAISPTPGVPMRSGRDGSYEQRTSTVQSVAYNTNGGVL